MSATRKIILTGAAIIALVSIAHIAGAKDKFFVRGQKTSTPTSEKPAANDHAAASSAAKTTAAKAATPAKSLPANSSPEKSSLSAVHTGSPDIFSIWDHQSTGNFGWGWLQLVKSYQGEPPTLPSQGAVTISNVELQGVYLGSSFATTNASKVTTLEAFLAYIAGSSYITELSPYGASTGTSVQGEVINVTLPQYTSSSPTFLQDLDILNYLATNIDNGTLVTPTSSTVYMVYVEPGVAVQAGISTSIDAFLGYHNVGQFTDSHGATQTVYYAVIPYPGSPNPTPASQNFSNETDELTAVSSHEIAEAITDPDTVNGWQETLQETVALKIFGWTLFKFTLPDAGEEIADVTLILNDYSSACYARLNGYLIQKVIAPDGVSLLPPGGSVAARRIASSPSQATQKSVQFLGKTFSLSW